MQTRPCNSAREWSFFTGQKVLTIGLSLIGGLSARQFVGVLAHEFGHFAQRFGMRCSFLVNSVNRWLEHCAYGEDAWSTKAAGVVRRRRLKRKAGSPRLIGLSSLVALVCNRADAPTDGARCLHVSLRLVALHVRGKWNSMPIDTRPC